MSGRDSDYIQYVNNFCQTIKVITTDLKRRFPDDPVVYRAHQRIITIISIDPKMVIDLCGPYLYQYRDTIYSENVDESSSFFIENEFDKEIKESSGGEKLELAKYIIPKMKECALSLPYEEKKQYKELTVNLLDDYIEYVAAIKKI
jgi:hypothetical protein